MKELFKDKLATLAEDSLMLEAIKVVVEDNIDKMKPNINEINNNEILGEKYRAAKEAEMLIKGVLEDISSYKIQRSEKKIINKGK